MEASALHNAAYKQKDRPAMGGLLSIKKSLYYTILIQCALYNKFQNIFFLLSSDMVAAKI